MAEPKSISFVVPCLNEELNVEPTINEIRAAVLDSFDYEIIVVDDGSTDGTLERIRTLATQDERLKVLHNEVNAGLGASYKRGIETAKSTYLMLIPGDNGFPGASIAHVLSYVGQADIVVPYVENATLRTPARLFISRAFTATLNTLFWLDVPYYNGIVVHKTALLRTIEITTDGFAYQAEALIKLICRGAPYVVCPVRMQERVAGASSAIRLRNLMTVLRAVLHLLRDVGPLRGFRLARGNASVAKLSVTATKGNGQDRLASKVSRCRPHDL